MGGPRSCAIFGQNPMRFAWGFDEEADECRAMKLELAQQIMVLRQQGVTQFYVGCDYGVGLYAAEIINVLRDNDPELLLFCVTPHEEQATKWTQQLRERYFDMLVKCTHLSAVSLHPQPDAQLEAYHYCYLLGRIEKRQYPPRMTPHLRQEIMKAESYRARLKFLQENGIETADDLNACQQQAESKIAQLAKLNQQIRAERKKLKLCKEISESAASMQRDVSVQEKVAHKREPEQTPIH